MFRKEAIQTFMHKLFQQFIKNTLLVCGNRKVHEKDTGFFSVGLGDGGGAGCGGVAVEGHFERVAVRPLVQNSAQRPTVIVHRTDLFAIAF